jgi:hypothetical protein
LRHPAIGNTEESLKREKKERKTKVKNGKEEKEKEEKNEEEEEDDDFSMFEGCDNSDGVDDGDPDIVHTTGKRRERGNKKVEGYSGGELKGVLQNDGVDAPQVDVAEN